MGGLGAPGSRASGVQSLGSDLTSASGDLGQPLSLPHLRQEHGESPTRLFKKSHGAHGVQRTGGRGTGGGSRVLGGGEAGPRSRQGAEGGVTKFLGWRGVPGTPLAQPHYESCKLGWPMCPWTPKGSCSASMDFVGMRGEKPLGPPQDLAGRQACQDRGWTSSCLKGSLTPASPLPVPAAPGPASGRSRTSTPADTPFSTGADGDAWVCPWAIPADPSLFLLLLFRVQGPAVHPPAQPWPPLQGRG